MVGAAFVDSTRRSGAEATGMVDKTGEKAFSGSSSGSGGGAAGGAPPAGGPVQVCARNLALTSLANHAYVEAPPKSYAVISPLCPQNWYDTPLSATSAQKWDNSPDPCGKTPSCVPCDPAPGVIDVRACLQSAFTAYANPSLYNAPRGPNSNTFAGTLARRCCANMVPKPAALGRVPGWDDPPAPARGGGKPCPPGPTC